MPHEITLILIFKARKTTPLYHGKLKSSLCGFVIHRPSSTTCSQIQTLKMGLIMCHFRSMIKTIIDMRISCQEIGAGGKWYVVFPQCNSFNTNLQLFYRTKSERKHQLMEQHSCRSFLAATRLQSLSQQVRMTTGLSTSPLATFITMSDGDIITGLHYWAF